MKGNIFIVLIEMSLTINEVELFFEFVFVFYIHVLYLVFIASLFF